MSTTAVPILDSSDIHLSVPLESPTKARPTTGMTGAPQPITVQPPVASPNTLENAPRTPPCPPAPRAQPWPPSCARRWTQRAK